MKKYLLIVAVFLGLQTQAQFFNSCDSLDIVVNSGSTTTTLMLDGIDMSNSASVWDWQISTNTGTNLFFSTQNISISPITTADTIMIVLSAYSNSPMGINCTMFMFSYYDGTNWVLDTLGNNYPWNPTGTGPGGLGSMSSHCDSINIVVDPLSSSTNVILNGDISTLPGTVTSWYWDVYDYNGFVQSSTTQSINFTASSTTDTLMVFMETTIVDTNSMPYICLHFGSLYYDGSTWVFTSAYLPVGPSNPGGGSTGGGVGNLFAVCDSLSIAIDPSATYANPVLSANVAVPTATVLTNEWQAFDNNGNFYADSTLLFSFSNAAPSDTIAVFVLSTVSDNGIVTSCMAFDMLVFNNGGWVSMRVGGSATGIEDVNTFLNDKKLVKVVDVLGRETKGIKNAPMFYIYNDGSVEKKMIIE